MEYMSSLIGIPVLVFIAIALWSFVWKGIALWTSARLDSKGWFITLLLINTLGILDILYIYIFSKRSYKESEPDEIVVEIEKE